VPQDQSGKGSRPGSSAGPGDNHTVLPSTTDLAQSFLQSEPREEREELEAAIASQSQYGQSQYGQHSVASSDDGDEELGAGTQGMLLPSFIAGFLKGVGDRLQVKIKNVILSMEMEVPRDLESSKQPGADSITTRLTIENMAMEGVTSSTDEEVSKAGKRLISLQNVQAMLIADPQLFTKFSSFSAPSSPAAPVAKPVRSQPPSSPSKSSSSMSSGAALAMTHSTIFEPTPSVQDDPYTLESSAYSHDGRFSDAGTDAEHGMDRSIGVRSALEASQYQDSVLDNPSYLDSVLDQVDDENMEDSIISRPAAQRPVARDTGSQIPRQPTDESPPSSRDSSPRNSGLKSSVPSYASIDNRNNAITKTQSNPERTLDTSLLLPKSTGNLSQRSASPPSERSSGSTPNNSSPGEDLAESKIFTHEEAESMYMSAVSHASESRNQTFKIPGAWDDSYSSPGSPLRKPKESISPIPGTIQEGQLRSADEVLDERCSTPKPQAPLAAFVVSESPRTPTKSDFKTTRQGKETRQNVDDITSETSSSSDGLSRMAKQIILIDSVSVWLPSTEAVTSSDDGGKESPRQVMAGRKSPPQSSRVLKSSPDGDSEPHDSKNSLEIDVSSVTVQFDISIGWLVTKIVQKLFNLWAINMPEGLVQKEEAPAPPSPPMQLSVQSLTINFLEHLQGQIHSSAALLSLKSMKPIYTESDVLLRTNILGLKVAKSTVKDVTKTQVDISNFSFGFASEHIIGFDAGLKMRESTRDILSPTRGDISILIRTADETSSATITTLPLHLTLNLQRIDEMFGWFGGLSAILEIGGSIASMSTVVGGSPKASRTSPRRSRGVHFEQRPKRGSLSGSDILSPAKANVRIGGLVVDVIGKDCSMLLETTAVKVINRPEVTGIQVDKARLSGPHIGNEDRDPAVMVDVLNTRVEYLFMPQEQDLDKLLSLLTPSKAKYDQGDDIMLDTLFRQRRQGPVLRVNFDGVKCSSYQSDDLDLLPKIAAEMATLSKVAKYLPEDDRPGILTLAKIKNLDAEVYMQGLVGTLRLAAQGVGAAHVSIPSLMAFKTASATFTRNGNEVLLRPCLPAPSGKAEFPMIMARFIADEMDPTIKIKLFNAQVEYTVPAVMALMGFNDNMTAEDIAINMAASVINFAEHYPDVPIRKIPSQSSTTSSDSSAASQTPFKLAVSIHDSVIGLNPRDLPSKGLLVLTDARFSGSLSKNNELEALVEIKKASIMVVDDIKNLSETESASTPPILQREQIEVLRQMGYMPIGYMSSAQAIVKMTQLEDDGDKSLDVEIRDDLFVLETCADSTQTLLSVLNGLSPPTPPSTVEKYRTQIMPLQDLLASMTGDAFVTDERADHEEYDMPDAIQEEPEDEESGPSDLGIDSGFFKGEAGGDSTEDLASMAEDELADSSTFSEATARSPKVTKASLGGSFHSQNSDALAMSELDFKEDHFSSKSAVGGTAHRWNSTQNTYGLTNEVKLGGSPLRVRVRDVHFIWNLFDGYDWQRTRDTISKAVKDVEARATERRARTGRRVSRDFEEEEDSVIGDFLFNSIYIGIPANRDPRELSGDINRGLDDLTSEAESYATTVTAGSPSRQGHERRAKSKKLRLQRSKQHKMTFELGGVSADLVVFPPDSGETQSSLDVRIGDLEIFDHVPTSTWKKFATYMYDAGEKETGTSMVHLEILSVKPIPDLAASELIVKVSQLIPQSISY
jgi:autophagy-related protein 2